MSTFQLKRKETHSFALFGSEWTPVSHFQFYLFSLSLHTGIQALDLIYGGFMLYHLDITTVQSFIVEA